jgi:hypothetical protein
MAALDQEPVGGHLVGVDVHACERLQDPTQEHLQVAVVAVVVLGDDLAQPVVVLVVGGLPWLAVAELGVLVGHGGQALEDEAELDRHRLLAPQGAVVVEHRHPLLRRKIAGPVAIGDRLDEPHDRLSRGGVGPRRQWVVDVRGRHRAPPRSGCHRQRLAAEVPGLLCGRQGHAVLTLEG